MNCMQFKQKTLISLTKRLCDGLNENRVVCLYSRPNPIGIVSFSYGDRFSQELAGLLSDYYDIAVRGGYHCSPLCHKFLNTEQNGLVRVSLSEMNTAGEIDEFLSAVNDLPRHLV